MSDVLDGSTESTESTESADFTESKDFTVSTDSLELRENLENIQKLLNQKNSKLLEHEKLLANHIVKNAQDINVIAPVAEIDENGVRYNFKLDYGTKELFDSISDSLKIDAYNDLQKSKYKKSRNVHLGFTEYFKTTGNNTNYFIRGDLSSFIENGLHDEITDVVLLELQAKHDKDIPQRMHAYGNNNLKLIRRPIKKLKKNKCIMVEDDVFVRPYEMIIYAATKFKKKQAFSDLMLQLQILRQMV